MPLGRVLDNWFVFGQGEWESEEARSKWGPNATEHSERDLRLSYCESL